jgi:hypothetical protein
VDLTYDVDGSSPSIRLSLHWPDPPDVSCLLIDSKEGISSLSLDDLFEGLNDEWDSVSLKLSHSLEGQDGLNRNPSVLVESSQGEEVSVDREVRVGKVEVDCLSAFATIKAERPTLLGGPGGERFTVFLGKGCNGVLLSLSCFCSGLGFLGGLRFLNRLRLCLGSLGLGLLDSGRVDLDLLGHFGVWCLVLKVCGYYCDAVAVYFFRLVGIEDGTRELIVYKVLEYCLLLLYKRYKSVTLIESRQS